MNREIIKIRFADYELQKNASNQWELRRGRNLIYLNSQTLDMMALLLERPGAYVSYSELEKCASASHDGNRHNFIAKQIEFIRKAIGDKKLGDSKYNSYQYIQTIPAKGYQWVYGEVEYEYGNVRVLLFSFVSVGQEAENGYVGLAVTKSIAAAIRKLPDFDITVADMQHKSSVERTEMAQQFECVIEGVYGIERGSLRVIGTVKTTSSRDEREQQFTCVRPKEEIFKFCDEVANEIIDKLVRLFPEKKSGKSLAGAGSSLLGQGKSIADDRGTDSEEAYEYYLKGHFLWLKRDVKSLLRGLNYFEQAAAADPKFYLPLIGIANSYLILCTFGTEHIAPKEAMPRAIVALRALPNDESLPDKHLSDVCAARATIHLLYEWDANRSIRAFETALDIFPRNDMARAWYAQCLSSIRRFTEAIKQINVARALSGYTSSVINATSALVLYRARNFNESIRRAKETLELDPTSMRGHIFLGLAQKAMGNLDAAVSTLQRAYDQYPDNSSLIGELGHAYGVAGRKSDALKMLQNLEKIRTGGSHASHYNDAKIYLSLKRFNECFDELEKAFQERSPWLTFLAVDPVFDVLKKDPRLIRLKRRIRAGKEHFFNP